MSMKFSLNAEPFIKDLKKITLRNHRNLQKGMYLAMAQLKDDADNISPKTPKQIVTTTNHTTKQTRQQANKAHP